MFYEQRITIQPNTTEANAYSIPLNVHPGIVKHVQVVFPPGCCGLAHLQVKYLERTIYPANINSDISGDGESISFDEDIILRDPPFEFTLVGWSEDDTYPHTIIVRMQILSEEQDIASLLKWLALEIG
jgi:hypothetical protein